MFFVSSGHGQQRTDIPAGTPRRAGAHSGDHRPGAGTDARRGERPVAGRLPGPRRHRRRHRPRGGPCALPRRRHYHRLRSPLLRRRTLLRDDPRRLDHRGRLRGAAPAGGRRRREVPRRSHGVPAPHRLAGPQAGHAGIPRRHELRQPADAAPDGEGALRLLRKDPLPQRRAAGI